MKKVWLMIVGVCVSAGLAQAADSAHRLGVGANYWKSVDSIDVQNIDDNGFSYYATYQYRPGLLGLELDAETLPDRFGKDSYAPAGYLVLGDALYVAAGVGSVKLGDQWANDPFYALKAGVDLELLPRIFLDITASYRVDSKVDLEDAVNAIDTDTVYLGAAVRFGF